MLALRKVQNEQMMLEMRTDEGEVDALKKSGKSPSKLEKSGEVAGASSENREPEPQKTSVPVIQRPKDLGDIRGISYIYAMFYRFGIIDVPEKVKAKMGR